MTSKSLFKFLLIFFIFPCFINLVFAQTKTPYEKKKQALTLQFLSNLGVNQATIKKYTATGDAAGLLYMTTISSKLQTEKGMQAYFKFVNDLKKAESLKTATDFKREAQQKAAKLAKEQAAEKESERLRIYENSDYRKIGDEIKNQFEGWAQKGEFEKTADYENRIVTEGSRRFDTICFNVVKSRIDPYCYKIKGNDPRENSIEILPQKYDADKEVYFFSVSKKYSSSGEQTGTLMIPVSKAKDFKYSFHRYGKVVNPKDWVFTNYNLIPTKITVFTGPSEDNPTEQSEQYVMNVFCSDAQDVVFSTSALKISIPKLAPCSYNFTRQAPEVIEAALQKEIDSAVKSLVDKAEKDERFQGKTRKDISNEDLFQYYIYNKKKIQYYKEALRLKDDLDVKNKLQQTEAVLKELPVKEGQ